MKDKIIINKANKITWVEQWMFHFNEKKSDYERIVADQLEDGRWYSEITLPLINVTTSAFGKTEVGAMLNVANKATKTIQNYLTIHSEIKWFPLSRCRHWEVHSDENGRYILIKLNSEYRKKNDEQIAMMQQESIKAVKKAIARINRVITPSKELFIQVLDRSLFEKDATNDEIYNKIFNTMYEKCGILVTTINCDNDNNHVIVVGYASSKEEFEAYLH